MISVNADKIFPSEIISRISTLLPKGSYSEDLNIDTHLNLSGNKTVPFTARISIVDEQKEKYAVVFLKEQTEKEKLLEELNQERKSFQALLKVTANAVSTLELDELLYRLLHRLVEVTGADTGVILLRDGDYLYTKTSVGYKDPTHADFRIKIGDGFAGTIASTKKPFYVEDAQKNENVLNPYIKEYGTISMFGVPLKRNGNLVGVVHVGWFDVHTLKDHETQLLEITAERCAMAIINAQLYEETKKLKENLNLRFERMPIGSIVWDTDFKVVSWNPAAENIFGYSEEEITGSHAYEYIVPGHIQPQIDDIWRRLLEGDMEAHSENENITKDGKTIICEWTNTPLIDHEGKVQGIISMVQDITERVEAQKALKNKIAELSRKNRFEESIRIIIDGIHKSIDLQDIMNSAVQLIQNNIEGADNVSIYLIEGNDVVLKAHKGYPSWYSERLQRIPKPKGFVWKAIIDQNPIFCNNTEEDDVIGPAGKEIGTKSYASIPMFYSGDAIGVVNINSYSLNAFSEDEIVFLEFMTRHVETAVNNAKKVEALRRSEKRFSSFMRNLPGLAFIKDSEGHYVYASEAFEEVFGMNITETIGKTDYEVWPSEIADQFVNNDQKVIKGNMVLETIQETLINKEKKYWFVNKFPISNGESTPLFIGGIALDITERKHIEEQLHEKATLLDIATDAIMVCDMNDTILYWNEGAKNLYGWEETDVIGKKTTELFNNESNFEEAFDKVKTDGEWKGELKQTTKDNEEIIVSSRWTLVKDNSGNPESVFVVNTDVTDSKQIQRQLLQAQRLESVGTLAGGIAHDLNNVLQPIMMSLGLLKEHINDEKAENWIHILEESANRGSSLVSQVLSFARGSEGEYKYLNINNLVKEIKKVLDETLPKSIEIHSDLDEEPWGISGDLTQLHQVIMNLCVNARDAMPDGGTLTISTENLDIDINYAQINVDAEVGPYVVITISDTGEGIPKGHIDKIFDPFYTTKDPEEGTGLGLSTSYSIIKDHGGFIHVYSDEGRGTEFKIYLPADKKDEDTPLEKERLKDIPKGDGELVLVVDDEAAIREITKRTLESNGYRVITASDGAEAVAVYTENNNKVEVVIMDMMMPVMYGPASITALKKLNPEVKIIASTGIKNDKSGVSDIDGSEVNAVLKKPYTTKQLLDIIHDVIKSE